ncbi:MAG TPA: polysaccharide biosynthesis/export family protein [Candidatus Limnocylindria bacterium]|jgi:protein involved in polysaccharide export with SLBB domain|nr:polysaccharide biosynthesis/export family protein [Candidatus Limnocylindria bacterium]
MLRGAPRVVALAVAAFATTLTPALAALHPGDKLDIVVFDYPDLSVQTTISTSGAVTVPLAGTFATAGLDPQRLRDEIVNHLAKYIVSPAVDVRVLAESNTAFLAGIASGPIALAPSQTLAMAISGVKLPPTADLSRVALIRDGKRTSYDLLAMMTSGDTSPQLVSGDVIDVLAGQVSVTVSGAVKQTVTAFLPVGGPLASALQQAQLADDANTTRIVLVRAGNDQVTAAGGPVMVAAARDGDQLVIPRFAQVTMLGQVAKAGPIVLKQDQSLLTAIAAVGGPGKNADLAQIVIRHADGTTSPKIDLTKVTRGDLAADPTLADGDLVFVPDKPKPRVNPKLLFAAILAAVAKYVKLPT